MSQYEDNLYDTAFEVLSVYDGPIDGWFYVKWGRSAERRPKVVKCSCDPCTTPCKEDGVPETELLASAPDLLDAYKLTDQYAFRVAVMRGAARARIGSCD